MNRHAAGVALALLVLLAGCNSVGGPQSTPTASATDSPTASPTQTFQAPQTPTPTPRSTVLPGGDIEVRIRGAGEWTGSVAYDGASKSVSGPVDRTIDVPDGIGVVSATVRKQSGGDWRLVVAIVVDGSVVRRDSTTAAYGRVGASGRFG